MSDKPIVVKTTKGEASGGVLVKLIIFSLSLGILPIASYFASLTYFWAGNATYAAITAVVAANAVLVAYIISSLLEDRASNSSVQIPKIPESRKER